MINLYRVQFKMYFHRVGGYQSLISFLIVVCRGYSEALSSALVILSAVDFPTVCANNVFIVFVS